VTVATQLLESKTRTWFESSELFKSSELWFVAKSKDLKLNGLPTMYNLPSENKTEEPALDEYHHIQADLLKDCFLLPDYPASQIFTAMDMYLYYDPAHPRWYKRADWFAVVGVPRLYKGRDLRQSYVLWDEGVSPFIVAEFLSSGTKDEDLGLTEEVEGKPPIKWKVYEQILKIPYYLIFDEEDKAGKLRVFKLVDEKYQELTITNNRLWIPELKIGIGVWHGNYEGMTRKWLHWYDANGEWLPTPLERAELRAEQERHQKEQERREKEQERREKEQAELRAEQERREKEQAKLRAEQEHREKEQERREKEQERQAKEKLAAKLRELGIDPTTII
jgi:Uma2 family endonuclease